MPGSWMTSRDKINSQLQIQGRCQTGTTRRVRNAGSADASLSLTGDWMKKQVVRAGYRQARVQRKPDPWASGHVAQTARGWREPRPF